VRSAIEQPVLRVSVIIPTYNRARYLREALDSVFGQSMPPWEVIVVDDGSTDGTPHVVQTCGSNVRYVRHEQNRGISAARNSGVSAAQGEIVAWLDSDDLWEPEYLATVIPLLAEDEGVDGVYTGLTRIDGEGNLLPQRSHWSVPSAVLFSSLVEGCMIQTSSFVVRKRCLDRVGEFDTRFAICEDYDMFLRIARDSQIIGVPRPLVRYRVHAQNTVNDPVAHCQSRLALAEKHFGSPDGDSLTWPDEKRRAHGYAFRAAALKCIEHKQLEKGWQYLGRGVSIFPALLECVDTFYELVCGDQPMGYRGVAKMLDINRNGAEMLHRLDALFASADTRVQVLRGVAYGNAYLALAMLSDQAGDWAGARRYLLRAMRFHPDFLRDPLLIRRFVKLCLGQRLVRGMRGLRPESAGRATEQE
jgi:glycosyltransferase involved in cell wall biosynthesis